MNEWGNVYCTWKMHILGINLLTKKRWWHWLGKLKAYQYHLVFGDDTNILNHQPAVWISDCAFLQRGCCLMMFRWRVVLLHEFIFTPIVFNTITISSPSSHTLASQTEGCLWAAFYIQFKDKVQCKPDHLFDNSIGLTRTTYYITDIIVWQLWLNLKLLGHRGCKEGGCLSWT